MNTRGQIAGALCLLAVGDTLIPVPFLALTLLWVVWRRPPWFQDLVRVVYGRGA